jgi:hypothetical protein
MLIVAAMSTAAAPTTAASAASVEKLFSRVPLTSPTLGVSALLKTVEVFLHYKSGPLKSRNIMPEENALALEELTYALEYALESWRQTPAIARCTCAQLIHYDA